MIWTPDIGFLTISDTVKSLYRKKPILVHYFVQKNQIIISKWFVKFKDFLTTVAYFNAIENCKFCGHFYYFEIIHSIVLWGKYSTLSV